MSTEFVSGFKIAEGDTIRGYKILRTFDPGAFAYSGKAKASSGRIVFFKKYKRPGAAAKWYDSFVAYQNELKQRVQANESAKKLCYEFIEFFELKKPGGAVPLRAFYQVFEWVEGGTDLRGVVSQARSTPSAFTWQQRLVFARVMMAGINAIHKAGIIHTDLKPENFYLVPADTPSRYALRVIDMDFSLIEGKQAPWHDTEGYVGTPGYMSPEHLSGKVPQKTSDVFTCALILGELLGSGHPSADNMDLYADRAKSGHLRTVCLERPIDEAADSEFVAFVINAAMSPDPRRRPSAEQVLRALSGQLAEFDGKRPKASAGASAKPSSTPPPSPIKSSPAPSGASTPKAPPVPVVSPSPAPKVAGAPPAPPSPALSGGLDIVGAGGQHLRVSLDTKLGRAHFRAWNSDCDKFMASEQFRVFKNPSGQWMVEHCSGATNATTVNGVPISGPTVIVTGMVIALGKTGKCPATLFLK